MVSPAVTWRQALAVVVFILCAALVWKVTLPGSFW